jgi:hypothetical protein
MKRFAPIIGLWLLAALAHADTFELSDPAAEMYQDRKEWDERNAEKERQRTAVCTYDAEADNCYCIDREKGQPVAMEREECLERAPRPLANPDS